jgi:folate-dependent phosphoribosylglycinamide formyltransferase PurN
MNLALLTTETLHHCFFLRELAAFCPPKLVVVEDNGEGPPFETHHPFEAQRDRYERRTWFGGRDVRLGDFAETFEISSVNEPDAVRRLAAAAPDVVVVFGTRRLGSHVIRLCADGIVNLHGGDPEHYRGLDTHLWAIYHGDFEGLVTTLHRVNPRLDDGDIVAQAPVSLADRMPLHELRSHNTELCVELVRSALTSFHQESRFHSRPQQRRGRYYSYMPAVLKGTCVEKFARRTVPALLGAVP